MDDYVKLMASLQDAASELKLLLRSRAALPNAKALRTSLFGLEAAIYNLERVLSDVQNSSDP